MYLNETSTIARRYGDLGWTTIPLHYPLIENGHAHCTCGRPECDHPGKHPQKNNWTQTDATPPDAFGDDHTNIGILTGRKSGIVVIDVDGNEGEASLIALQEELGPLPESCTARTGSGGRHLYFQCETILKNKVGILGLPKLDFRADGGQVVAPPSLHRSGRRYEWIESPFQTTPALLPDAYISAITNGRKTKQITAPTPPIQRSVLSVAAPIVPNEWLNDKNYIRAKSYVHQIPGVGEGERNNQGFNVACRLVNDFARPLDQARTLLASWNETNSPPMDELELESILRSAQSNSQGMRGSLLVVDPTPPQEVPAKSSSLVDLVVTLDELEPEQPREWLWYSFLCVGKKTVLSGLPKTGKSTLLYYALHQMKATGKLITPIKSCKVLILTEEPKDEWHNRQEIFGLSDHNIDMIFAQDLRSSTRSAAGWGAFLQQVARLVDDRGYQLVIFDTISKFWSVEDENDAVKVNRAFDPIDRHLSKPAVLIVHHDAKSGTVRGSTAITASVDIVMQLKRVGDDKADSRRKLILDTRLTPPTIYDLDYDEETGYRSMPNPKDEAELKRINDIRSHLTNELLPIDKIQETTGIGYGTLYRLLMKGSAMGYFERSGSGKRNDPYRYSAKTGNEPPPTMDELLTQPVEGIDPEDDWKIEDDSANRPARMTPKEMADLFDVSANWEDEDDDRDDANPPMTFD